MNKVPGYVYWPVLAFVALFAVDKLFLIPKLKLLSQPDATFLYYDYKSELLDELEEVHANQQLRITDAPVGKDGVPVVSVRKKTFLVLGSSRLLYFDYDAYARAYADWEMFNFSAPVTAPAYYLYILERVVDRGIKPDYILVEVDPFQFNAGSDAFERSNLAYSFDFRFMWDHFSLFKRREVSYFLARNLFAGYKYPPDLGTMFGRLINPIDRFTLAFNDMDQYQRTHRGGGRSIIPRENWYERDFPNLEGTAVLTLNWLYRNYRLDERQFVFFEKLLALAKANDIDVMLVRPPVSRPMIRRMREDPRLARRLTQWQERLDRARDGYDYGYLDLQDHPEYYCNTYVDAAHMAKDCYRPMMSLVMREYFERTVAAARGGAVVVGRTERNP